MKKLFALLMAAMMLLCCVACGGGNDTPNPPTDTTASITIGTGRKHNSQNSSRRGKYFYDPASADTGYHPGIDGTGWGRKICDSTWQYQWH